MTSVSVVVPVYNSEGCLPELLLRLAGIECITQVILVDDYSTDRSRDVIADLEIQYSGLVEPVYLSRNFGQDNALMAGLSRISGDYAVIMDDDLQHDPAYIPKLLEKCADGADACYANYNLKQQSWWKNIGSKINGSIAMRILGKPPDLYLSPYKILARSLADEICRYQGPYPYVDGLILRSTSNISQIEISHNERFDGDSTYTLARSASVFLKHVTGFSILPLRIVTFVGIGAFAGGIVLSLYYLGLYFLGVPSPLGWTTLICIMLVLGGMILLGLGLIGEYLGRIYLLLNQHPQYTEAAPREDSHNIEG